MSAFINFDDFFHAVHGVHPYQWQKDTAAYIDMTGRVPGQVRVPTGLGKTSTIDAVVWALAKQVYEGRKRSIGQRIFFCVERRIIVDGVGEHVTHLIDAINEGATHPKHKLYTLAQALGSLKLATLERDEHVISQTTFHGSRNGGNDWLNPHGCQIIATTATQLTLRLGGKAPGVGHGSAPIHAGLVGMDSVIIFDEPQLAAPQVSVVHDIVELQSKYSVGSVPNPQLSVLGATIPPGVRLPAGTIACDMARESQSACAKFVSPRPVVVAPCATTDTVATLVDMTQEHIAYGDNRSILVVVNTVRDARRVEDLLTKKLTNTQWTTRLVTSRVRAYDRVASTDFAEKNIVTISTQVIEAGADFEVDSLITELAPLPALIQRLGRLNRYGTAVKPCAHVINPRKKTSKYIAYGSKGSIAIYGDNPLIQLGVALDGYVQAHGEQTALDFALSNQQMLRTELEGYVGDYYKQHLMSAIDKGVLRTPGADNWWPVQPYPAVVTEQLASIHLESSSQVDNIDTWLGGIQPEKTAATPVTLLWRDSGYGELDASSVMKMEPADKQRRQAGLCAVMRAGNPLAAETIDVPLSEAQAVVAGVKYNADSDDGSDSSVTTINLDKINKKRILPAIVLRDSPHPLNDPRDIIPGDVVVIDAACGGYTPNEGVCAGSSTPVADIGLVIAADNPRARVALTYGSVRGLGLSSNQAQEIMHWVQDNTLSVKKRARHVIEVLGSKWSVTRGASDDVYWIVQQAVAVHDSGDCVTLRDHLLDVACIAQASSQQLDIGLDDDFYRTGALHDVGKAAPFFQRMLGALPGDELLAKSTGRVATRPDFAGMPSHYRHELASYKAALSTGDYSDTTAYLIASHHGRGRGPWYGRGDSVVLGRLRHKLEAQYGPWGLAYIEAVFRCADRDVSIAGTLSHHSVDSVASYVDDAIAYVIRHSQTGRIDILDGYEGGRRSQVYHHRLEGIPANSILAWGAALGTLVWVTSRDKNALMYFDNGTPVIETTRPVDVFDGASHAVLATLHDIDTHIATVTAKKVGLGTAKYNHLKHSGEVLTPGDIEQCYQVIDVPEFFTRAMVTAFPIDKRRDKNSACEQGVARLDLNFNHANSCVIGNLFGLGDEGAIDEVLWDIDAGWTTCGAKTVGKLDFIDESTTYRSGAITLAILGFMSSVITQPLGLGFNAHNRKEGWLPLPDYPVTVDELSSLARMGNVGSGQGLHFQRLSDDKMVKFHAPVVVDMGS